MMEAAQATAQGDEAAALMLGLRFVLRRGDADLSNAATRARAKLAAVLPARFDDSAAAGATKFPAAPETMMSSGPMASAAAFIAASTDA